jgi:hypothetical protein
MLSGCSSSPTTSFKSTTVDETKLDMSDQNSIEEVQESTSRRDSEVYQRPKSEGQRPLIVRYLIFITIGSSVILLPGMISYYLYTVPQDPSQPRSLSNMKGIGMLIEGTPFIRYAIFLAISWTLLWAMLYAALVIPEVLIRIINMIARAFNVLNQAQHLTRWLMHAKSLRIYVGSFFWVSCLLILVHFKRLVLGY